MSWHGMFYSELLSKEISENLFQTIWFLSFLLIAIQNLWIRSHCQRHYIPWLGGEPRWNWAGSFSLLAFSHNCRDAMQASGKEKASVDSLICKLCELYQHTRHDEPSGLRVSWLLGRVFWENNNVFFGCTWGQLHREKLISDTINSREKCIVGEVTDISRNLLRLR